MTLIRPRGEELRKLEEAIDAEGGIRKPGTEKLLAEKIDLDKRYYWTDYSASFRYSTYKFLIHVAIIHFLVIFYH